MSRPRSQLKDVVPAHVRRALKRVPSSLRMSRVRDPAVASAQGEIRLFMVVRNERLRLPYILKYHMMQGVDRAIVVDNGSTDGTLEWLRDQSHVHVVTTHETYRRHGVWFDVLLHRYGHGHWCLLLDADEILTYPHADVMDLKALTRYLDAQGETALHVLMLDMYARKLTKDMTYKEGQDPLEVTPFFDTQFDKKPFHYVNCHTPIDYQFMGGVRGRVFNKPVCCSKFPLFKFRKGVFVPGGFHSIEGARFNELQGAILHFKFLQDFTDRALLEAEREEHWNGAEEYKAYAGLIKRTGDISFWTEDSVQFESPDQLVALGLMRDIDTLRDYAATYDVASS